jgi:hypothetical protein
MAAVEASTTPSILNEDCQIGQCRSDDISPSAIVCEQAKIGEVEPRANCAADERVLAERPRCLPSPGTDRANRCVRPAADQT